MTREEAAEILNYPVFKWSLDWGEYAHGVPYCDAIQMAIDALEGSSQKLSRSRWPGCKSCKLKNGFVRYHEFPYCPICGKPLTEEAWAELERRIGDESDV